MTRLRVLLLLLFGIVERTVSVPVTLPSVKPFTQSVSPPGGVVLWNYDEYPILDPKSLQCREPDSLSTRPSVNASFVCDPDRVLSTAQLTELGELLREISALPGSHCPVSGADGATAVPFGLAIARYIYKNYQLVRVGKRNNELPRHSELPNESNQRFANQLRMKWKLGLCDNDVLLLLVAGQGNAVSLTSSVGERAADVVRPALETIANSTEFNQFFSNGEIFQGLRFVLKGVKRLLKTAQKAPTHITDSTGDPTGSNGQLTSEQSAIVVIGVLLAFLMLITILLGLILHSSRHFKRVDTISDPTRPQPKGYFTQTRDSDKACGFEPVTIEESENPTQTERKNSREQQQQHGDLHGKDELLETSDQISLSESETEDRAATSMDPDPGAVRESKL